MDARRVASANWALRSAGAASAVAPTPAPAAAASGPLPAPAPPSLTCMPAICAATPSTAVIGAAPRTAPSVSPPLACAPSVAPPCGPSVSAPPAGGPAGTPGAAAVTGRASAACDTTPDTSPLPPCSTGAPEPAASPESLMLVRSALGSTCEAGTRTGPTPRASETGVDTSHEQTRRYRQATAGTAHATTATAATTDR